MKQGLTFDDVALSPVFNNIESRTEPDLKAQLTENVWMGIPILASNMDTVISEELAQVLLQAGSIPIWHRFASFEKRKYWADGCPSFISSGIRQGDLVETEKLLDETGCLGVCFDIAHGHDARLIKCISSLRSKFPDVEIIAGNVCTADGYRDLVNAGATAVKVGIGPGAACTTRMVTGFGVPQFTAIRDIADAKRRLLVPIIADGGIRNSSDIVKALAAGANTVMLGKLFALTNESAAPKRWFPASGGEPVYFSANHNQNGYSAPGKELEAKYRGQASSDFQEEYFGATKDGTVPEGEAFWAPVTGPAIDVIQKLLAGVRSGMTYGGARSIEELQRKAEFIQVTGNYQAESSPRP